MPGKYWLCPSCGAANELKVAILEDQSAWLFCFSCEADQAVGVEDTHEPPPRKPEAPKPPTPEEVEIASLRAHIAALEGVIADLRAAKAPHAPRWVRRSGRPGLELHVAVPRWVKVGSVRPHPDGYEWEARVTQNPGVPSRGVAVTHEEAVAALRSAVGSEADGAGSPDPVAVGGDS